MYPRFIEVHDSVSGGEEFINVDSIEGVFTEMVTGNILVTHIDVADGEYYQVLETYEEIKQLITETGCLIHKADPRLEKTPISWEDLCRLEMIGEPLWNSNTRRWMLLIDSASDNSWIELITHSGSHEKWIEHDAQRFPLYRMKGSDNEQK